MRERLFVEVRMLRNIMMHSLHDMNGNALVPKHSMRELEPNWRGLRPVVPVFDLENTIHKVEIPDVRPRMPKRPDGCSDAFYERLCDAAYTVAIQAREKGEKLRKTLQHHIDRGNLELVSDAWGFMDSDDELTEVERVLADKVNADEADRISKIDHSAAGQRIK